MFHNVLSVSKLNLSIRKHLKTLRVIAHTSVEMGECIYEFYIFLEKLVKTYIDEIVRLHGVLGTIVSDIDKQKGKLQN